LPRLVQTNPRFDPPSPKRSGLSREPAHPASASRQVATTTRGWATTPTVNDRHPSGQCARGAHPLQRGAAPGVLRSCSRTQWRAIVPPQQGDACGSAQVRASSRARPGSVSIATCRAQPGLSVPAATRGQRDSRPRAAPTDARMSAPHGDGSGQCSAGGGSTGGGARVPAASARDQVSQAVAAAD